MDYLADVLGCGRIQIFLDSHPEKSGFPFFPDLPVRMSRKPPASRTCWFACRGSRRLPGLAGSRRALAFSVGAVHGAVKKMFERFGAAHSPPCITAAERKRDVSDSRSWAVIDRP